MSSHITNDYLLAIAATGGTTAQILLTEPSRDHGMTSGSRSVTHPEPRRCRRLVTFLLRTNPDILAEANFELPGRSGCDRSEGHRFWIAGQPPLAATNWLRSRPTTDLIAEEGRLAEGRVPSK